MHEKKNKKYMQKKLLKLQKQILTKFAQMVALE